MTRAEIYKLIELVDAIKAGNATLSDLGQYPKMTVAAAVKELIAAEREACAILAEDAAEPGGVLGRGEKVASADPAERDLCQEIARRIRARRD